MATSTKVSGNGEARQIGPDQDLNDFPRWVWPYINVAHQAIFKAVIGAVAKNPEASHAVAVAVRASMMDVLDDWCGTKPRPRPRPWGPLASMVLAQQLNELGAMSGSDALQEDLNAVANEISHRALSV